MKNLRLLCVAAAAVMATMAMAGISTASATVLCKNNLNTTTCSEKYPANTEIKGALVAGTKSDLETEYATVQCEEVTVHGKTENEGSSTSTVKGPIQTLTFQKCNCTVTTLKLGTLEVHHISGTDNGTLTANGQEITLVCSTIFGAVHCIYVGKNTDLGTVTGGNPAVAHINATIPRLPTSPLCEGKALWTATIEVTSPKPLYFAAG